MKTSCIVIACWLITGCATSQQVEMVYKTIDTNQLKLYFEYPENYVTEVNHPCIVFFHGGGWKGGSPEQFRPHAEYFASRGMVCIMAEYRLQKKHEATPFQSLQDAKSAMRFIRQHAITWKLDTTKIAAGGGSAGGHLAAACAVCPGFNSANDDTTTSCKPNALVLFNAVIDNGPAGYGYERVGKHYKNFSPLHNIDNTTPPTIFIQGGADKLVPNETVLYFKISIERMGGRCDVHIYDGQPHGFYNYNKSKKHFDQTVRQVAQFLTELGYL